MVLHWDLMVFELRASINFSYLPHTRSVVDLWVYLAYNRTGLS